MNAKRWTLSFLALTALLLILPALPTAWIDPFFHFGPPKPQLSYPLNEARYQNDGIVRHFDYDALICGSSMTQNFKTSEQDALFGTSSIKVSLAGASYRESHDLVLKALERNPDLTLVNWALDCAKLRDSWDSLAYEESTYPWYLYDENPFNDVKYLFNKDILFQNTLGAITHTRSGRETTSFDDYSNWMEGRVFGKEAILQRYDRSWEGEAVPVTEADVSRLRESITRNVTDLASAYPKTDFYIFFPPYSAYWWDGVCRQGELELYIALFTEASGLMLEYDNIHLFAFFDDTDLVCDPDNYKDHIHYHEDINSRILQWMAAGEHRLTRENYLDYWAGIKDFYGAYDYDVLYEP